MAKNKKSAKKSSASPKKTSGLADPETLKPYLTKPEEVITGNVEPGEELLQVIIETPKGSRNKYAFDADQKIFHLKTALPAGMVFPYDFGFLPQTKADDGDPIDVLVLMDEPAFPGCALMARLIGVIEGEQTSPKQKPTRNDRLVAVADTAHMYANLQRIKDLPDQALHEIEQFFVNYHRLQGKRYKLLACRGPQHARKLIEQTRRNNRQPSS